ncbi:hypothetical protein Tco_0528140 [Tanacetum coccineum]
MEISIADQIALDDALVAPADRLKIGKCNLRLSSDVTSKEATLQVVYDVLKLTPFYKAFQVTADAPEIYMQEFWASAYVHNRSVRFKMNNKKHILDLDQFRDILQICPKVGNKKFEEPPLEKEILAFLANLGYSGEIRKITDVNVNKLHQPWRSFAAIINKCLSGKPSYDSLRLSQAQILWGMYNKKKVDYAYLMWEDFTYQIENKNTKKGNAINKVNWHYARDDLIFTMINVISRNEDTQLYGAILPIELTNKDIRISESDKEYHAIASRKIPSKMKGSKKKANTDTSTKMKPPTVPKDKKEKKSGKGKQKLKEFRDNLYAVFDIAEQLKIITKRSRKETHSSHASGSGVAEGTGVIPGVPDAPDYDSDNDISWKSSDEDDDIHDDDENAQDDDDEAQFESKDDGDDFIHPKLTTYDDEIIHEMRKLMKNETDRSIVHTPSRISTISMTKTVNIRLKGLMLKGANSNEVQATQKMKTSVTLNSIHPDGQQQSSLLYQLASSQQCKSKSRYGVTVLDNKHKAPSNKILLKALEDNFSELRQTNQYAEALSSIPGIVDHYLTNKMQEAVDVAVQLKYDKIREESHNENQQFLDSIDEGMKKVIKEQVKKEVSKDHPKIDKFITIKRPRDGANDDQEPSAGTDRGSKRRRSGKEPESTSAPRETTTTAVGKTTTDVYKATQKNWTGSTPKRQYPQILRQPLPLVPNSQGMYDILYKFKEGDFHRLRIQDIEDMLLLLVQGKVTNLNVEERIAFNVSLRMFTRSVSSTANIRVNSFTMKMEILLEPTSNKLMVEHAEYDESNTYVLERFNTTAGNPVKKILLKLNLSDHRILKDGGGVKEVQRSFRHSDTERLSRSDEVLKLKNFKKDATLKLSKSTNQESSRNKLNPEINDHYNIFTGESQEYELKTKDEAVGILKEPVEEPIAEVVMYDAGKDVVRDDHQPQDTSEPKTAKTPNLEWFTQPLRPPTLDTEWNKRQVDNPEGDRYPFDLSKPLPLQGHTGHLNVAADYFFNNDLENLKSSDPERTYTTSITKTKAARYEIERIEEMVPMIWSPTKMGYEKDALKGIKHWVKGSVSVKKLHGYGHLEEIVVKRADRQFYKFKEGDFVDLHLNDIEDMRGGGGGGMLLAVQHKLFHLTDSDIVDFIVALHMFTRSLVIKKRVEDLQLGVESYQKKINITPPQQTFPEIELKELYIPSHKPLGVIYEDLTKQKRVMRADELYKFSDGTLKKFQDEIHHRVRDFRLEYNKEMPKRKWMAIDRKRSKLMVELIDKQMRERKIIQNLERLVGARKLKMDYKLMTRTT